MAGLNDTRAKPEDLPKFNRRQRNVLCVRRYTDSAYRRIVADWVGQWIVCHEPPRVAGADQQRRQLQARTCALGASHRD
jgi:hypothetical protein